MSEHEHYLIPVSEYTTPCPITVSPETTVAEIISLLKAEGIRHLPVTDVDNKPIGIISERDINLLAKHVEQHGVMIAQDVMTPGPYLISPDLPLEKAAFDLSKYKIGSALVVEKDGTLSGIFTSTDALNALVEVMRGDIDD
ncbi:MAG: CBS domain-containing protein [Bdellovibrionota bacterium]